MCVGAALAQTLVSTSLSVATHGNQDSMPSKVAPCAIRSQFSCPQGSLAIKSCARVATSELIINSRAGNICTVSRSSVLRWSLTLNAVSRSTSSPHRSMRTGVSDVDGNTSMIEPRRANSPRCSTSSSRRYPKRASVTINSSISTCVFCLTTSGSTTVLLRC